MLLELGVKDVFTTVEEVHYLIKGIQNTVTCLDQQVTFDYQSSTKHRFNERDHTIMVNGNFVGLTGREWKIFSYLYDYRNQVLLYEEITDYLWPNSKAVNKMNVANIVHSLREKIREDKFLQLLTGRKIGYQLFVKE